MLGWQITLVGVAAALFAVTAAVLLDRARMARRAMLGARPEQPPPTALDPVADDRLRALIRWSCPVSATEG
jgi:hypothetical protein